MPSSRCAVLLKGQIIGRPYAFVKEIDAVRQRADVIAHRRVGSIDHCDGREDERVFRHRLPT